jgi:hypothetical protein
VVQLPWNIDKRREMSDGCSKYLKIVMITFDEFETFYSRICQFYRSTRESTTTRQHLIAYHTVVMSAKVRKDLAQTMDVILEETYSSCKPT